MRGKNRCYVCFRKHLKIWKISFPEDFPNKMKLCCACRNCSSFISHHGVNALLEELKRRRKYLSIYTRIFYKRVAKKVNELITIG